jgi:hypothetical protein
MTTTLRCYVCGKALDKQFCLATMSEDTDRVFTVHDDCAKQLDKDVTVICVSVQFVP